MLYWRVNREISIRYHFQPFHRSLAKLRWPARNQPCQLELRQRGYLGKSAESERKPQLLLARESFGGSTGMCKIEENFIGDQSQLPLSTQLQQRQPFCLADERSRRIIRIHHQHRPGSRRHCRFKRVQVDMPAVIVEERVRRELHVLYSRQQVEQRIARRRDQHLIARIAKQSKQERVGLARAGC